MPRRRRRYTSQPPRGGAERHVGATRATAWRSPNAFADRPQANFVPAIALEDPVPLTPKSIHHPVLNYHDITYLPVDRAKMNQRRSPR
jgi:hypothetical protein